MDYYWNIAALAIGYYYARKHGRDASTIINKYYAAKKSSNSQN